MERIVRILNQSGLQTRQYMDRKTGDQKVINSVVLKLTDGIDTFLGEITGERAVNCPKYDPQYIYKVQCSMVVREWNSQQTGEAMQATTIYIDKMIFDKAAIKREQSQTRMSFAEREQARSKIKGKRHKDITTNFTN